MQDTKLIRSSGLNRKRAHRIGLHIGIGLLICIIILAAVFLIPGLIQRWTNYNLSMLIRMTDRMFPYFWIHCGIAVAVFLLEMAVVGWKNSSLRSLLHPDKSLISDIWIFLVNALYLDYIIVFLLTLGATHKLRIGVKAAIGMDEGLLASAIASPVIQMLMYIIIADFVLYMEHFLHHRLSFLWAFHSYHHSATQLNVLTGNRGHPVQAELTNSIISVVPLAIIGVPLVSLFAFRLLRNTLVFLHHSRIPWSWGWIGRHILVSPAYHRIHHSVRPEHYDKNLAVMFPLWDHLFGTYYKGSVPALETGLPDNPYNCKSFLDDMIVPFRMFSKKG